MSKYTYYVYEYCSGRLVCLDLIREAFISDFVNVHNMRTLQYEFKDKVFETLNEFLYYLNQLMVVSPLHMLRISELILRT